MPGRGSPARSAWCYGAPGVAHALWLAGTALGDHDLHDVATEAMAAVLRRPAHMRFIDSPTFCHGVAGLLQIVLRFAHATRLPFLHDAADHLWSSCPLPTSLSARGATPRWIPGTTRWTTWDSSTVRLAWRLRFWPRPQMPCPRGTDYFYSPEAPRRHRRRPQATDIRTGRAPRCGLAGSTRTFGFAPRSWRTPCHDV
ncbi:lanthionine synthetase LanC family protein [Streptomyces sp. L2]|uniref:lanthionine synthetase LanC family protein n=1 Tax=Streptomyces sp. L2 TaxID=2162665 RepID=UPI00240E6618|nr:lanthionine synthetase LanC family protein [Streptomyces sp. L2]